MLLFAPLLPADEPPLALPAAPGGPESRGGAESLGGVESPESQAPMPKAPRAVSRTERLPRVSRISQP